MRSPFENEMNSEKCDLATLQSLYALNPCDQTTLERCFRNVCVRYRHNDVHFQVAKWIYSIYPNITITPQSFESVCGDLGLHEFTLWLYSIDPKLVTEMCDERFGRICCRNFQYDDLKAKNLVDLVKWIYSIQPNLSISQKSLWNICMNGRNFEMIHWICTTKPEYVSLLTDDIFTRSVEFVKDERILDFYLSIKPEWENLITNELFRTVCQKYNRKIAEWMISKKPDVIDILEDVLKDIFEEYSEEFDREGYPYTEFCRYRFDFLELFFFYKPEVSLLKIAIHKIFDGSDQLRCEDKDIQKCIMKCAEKNPMIYLNLRQFLLEEDAYLNEHLLPLLGWTNTMIQTYPVTIEITQIKRVQHIDFCSICYDKNSEVITECNHQFCKTCILDWYAQKDECPCCRHKLESSSLFYILSNE